MKTERTRRTRRTRSRRPRSRRPQARPLRLAALGLLIVLLGLLTLPLAADPYAATVSQVDWNAETQHLEVALRATPEALERALSAYFGTTIRLDKPDDKLERRLKAYLRDTFVAESKDGTKADLLWLGFELESHRQVWLYFELPLPAGLDGAKLSVRLFFEIEPRELNVVRLRENGHQRAWTLSREKPTTLLSDPSDPDPEAEAVRP